MTDRCAEMDTGGPSPPRRVARLALRVLAAVVLVVAGARAAWCATVSLTDLDRYYVDRFGTVALCVDPDWIPFEAINERGEHVGIAADLLRLIAERTGVRFRLVPTTSWDESIAASQQGRCDALSFLNETPSRKEWLVFTEPVFTDVNVFITREEHPFIADPGVLEGETLVLPRGTSMEEFIRRDYPNIRVLLVDTEAQALRAVSERKADMTLRSLIVAAYTIKKEGWFNLKISGQLPGYTNKLRIGLVRDKEQLVDVLNKGIASISGQDRGVIINRHVSMNVQTVVDYSLLIKVSGVLVLVIVFVAAWVWQLKVHNRELRRISQTDTLTGLCNRSKLNAVLTHEYLRAMRKWHPLSVVLIDVDHFKAVNDTLGHMVGDSVLRELGGILRGAVRGMDTVGRWGGEEFLIICPETDTAGAIVVAERVLRAVEGCCFSSRRPQSVSIGVASLSEDDSIDTLLMHADTALYAAKAAGRGRVCAAPDPSERQE